MSGDPIQYVQDHIHEFSPEELTVIREFDRLNKIIQRAAELLRTARNIQLFHYEGEVDWTTERDQWLKDAGFNNKEEHHGRKESESTGKPGSAGRP